MTARTRVLAGLTVVGLIAASIYGISWLGRQAGDSISLVTEAQAQGGPPRDNIIDGTLYPQGYTPVEIKNGVDPRVYAPNTEKLGPKEMRVTALGTGMPNLITGRQKASGWYVEL